MAVTSANATAPASKEEKSITLAFSLYEGRYEHTIDLVVEDGQLTHINDGRSAMTFDVPYNDEAAWTDVIDLLIGQLVYDATKKHGDGYPYNSSWSPDGDSSRHTLTMKRGDKELFKADADDGDGLMRTAKRYLDALQYMRL